MTAADSGDDAQRQASPGGPATLIARFQVDSFEPRQVAGLDAEWVGLMTFAKTFTSGITGQATTLFYLARTVSFGMRESNPAKGSQQEGGDSCSLHVCRTMPRYLS